MIHSVRKLGCIPADLSSHKYTVRENRWCCLYILLLFIVLFWVVEGPLHLCQITNGNSCLNVSRYLINVCCTHMYLLVHIVFITLLALIVQTDCCGQWPVHTTISCNSYGDAIMWIHRYNCVMSNSYLYHICNVV